MAVQSVHIKSNKASDHLCTRSRSWQWICQDRRGTKSTDYNAGKYHGHRESKEPKKKSEQDEILACIVGLNCWFNDDLSKNKSQRRGAHWMHRKCELVTGELSGGSRSGVEGEQKLCKPHTERQRGPRTHSLTPSLSVYTFLSTPPPVICLSGNVFLHLFVESKCFSICPP